MRAGRPELNFYADYLGRGRAACVPMRWIATAEALQLLSDCGAVPVLAHPGAGVFRAGSRLIGALRGEGLMGVEAFTSYHDDKVSQYYLNIARKLSLIPTTGSDFHGRVKPHVAFGSVRAIGHELVPVLKKYRHQTFTASGSQTQCS